MVPATTLLVGDCFSFLSSGSSRTSPPRRARRQHTYIVIEQGELTADQVDEAGGMQNALSAACAEPFDTFKASTAEGTKPQLEFLVANLEHDGKTWSAYSCVATDGTITAGAEHPQRPGTHSMSIGSGLMRSPSAYATTPSDSIRMRPAR